MSIPSKQRQGRGNIACQHMYEIQKSMHGCLRNREMNPPGYRPEETLQIKAADEVTMSLYGLFMNQTLSSR